MAPLIILIFLYTKMSLAISQQHCLSTKLKDCCQPKKKIRTLFGNFCPCYCYCPADLLYQGVMFPVLVGMERIAHTVILSLIRTAFRDFSITVIREAYLHFLVNINQRYLKYFMFSSCCGSGFFPLLGSFSCSASYLCLLQA